jgi:hypothetical protein
MAAAPGGGDDNQAWVAARSEYIAGLDEEERRLFEDATPENLLFNATTAQTSHEQASQSRAIFRRLKPFLSVIESYGAALDVYSNIYPLALALIWGSLRVMLHLATNFNKIFDRVVDVLERIGYVLPRFRDYERVFGSHPRVIRALSAAYLDIISLCSEINPFIRSIQNSRIKSFTKLFSPLNHHLAEAVGRFRQHREDVEQEAEACHMIKAAKHHELELRDRALAAAKLKSDLRKRLLSLLSPIDSSAKQRKLWQSRHDGTGEWIFEESDYQKWKEAPQNSVLSIFGIPRSGKTILSSHVIEKLEQEQCDQMVVTYHFCDYKDPRSLDPVIVAGTLIKDLLASIDISDELSALIQEAYQEGQKSPNEAETFQILNHVLSLRLSFVIYAVVDGVDELLERDRVVVLKFLKHLMECCHPKIKLVLSSRADSSSLVRHTHTESYRVHVSQQSVSGDVACFVHHSVSRLIGSGELLVRQPSLEEKIVQRLVDGARGM